MKNIVVVLALAIAASLLVGCGGLPNRGEQTQVSSPSSVVQPPPPAASQAVQPVQRLVAKAIVAAQPPVVRTGPASPNSFASLQPFKQFAKGAGEGIAHEYKPRTKAQFVALLRNKQLAKKEMRVTCDVLVRQMMEAHPGLPFEGCEGAAAAIENDNDFTVAVCRNEMFQRKNFLTVTNEKGSAFGIWHRKCLQNEQVLVYKGQPLISLTCLNVAIPVFIPPTPPKHACAEINFFARAGDTVARNAVGGGTAFGDDCFAIKKVGEAEFRAPWKDSCASEHCTFAASEAFLHKKMWMLASYELEEGEYVLRVPASFAEKNSPYVTILCLERTKMPWPELPKEMEAKAKAALANKPQEPVRGSDANAYAREYSVYLIAFKQWRADYASLYDEMKPAVEVYSKQRDEWIVGHSDSVNVWPNAYHVGSDGVPRATIYYTEAEVPASEPVKMWWRYTWVAEHSQQYQR